MKRIMISLLTIGCAFFAAVAEARTMIAKCSNFKAFHTDYTTEKMPSNDKPTVKKFNENRSNMLSDELIVVWELGNSKAKMKFKEWKHKGYSEQSARPWEEVNLILNRTEFREQLTFVGFSDGNPVMFSIYPDHGVMYFSQQGRSSLENGGGWVSMFHANCTVY